MYFHHDNNYLYIYIKVGKRPSVYNMGWSHKRQASGRIPCRSWADGQLCSYRPTATEKCVLVGQGREHCHSMMGSLGSSGGYLGLGVWGGAWLGSGIPATGLMQSPCHRSCHLQGPGHAQDETGATEPCLLESGQRESIWPRPLLDRQGDRGPERPYSEYSWAGSPDPLWWGKCSPLDLAPSGRSHCSAFTGLSPQPGGGVQGTLAALAVLGLASLGELPRGAEGGRTQGPWQYGHLAWMPTGPGRE